MSDESPLKTLYDFLNEQVYSKMKKKDVKYLRSGSLKGLLLEEIDLYANKKYEKRENEYKSEMNILKNNNNELKRRLQKYEPLPDTGYGKGRYSGD